MGRNSRKAWWIGCLLLGVLPTLSFAQDSLTVPIKPLRLSFTVKELGKVSVSLNVERQFGVAKSHRFYQGVARFKRHSFPVAASENAKVFTLKFPGKVTGSRQSRQRLYGVRLGRNKAQVASVPRSAMPEAACSTMGASDVSHLSVVPEISARAKEVVKVITLSAYTDPEWQFLHGASSDADVVEAINTAEVIYNRQLGIRFRLNGITNLSSSTPETDPGEVLRTFRVIPEAQTESNLKSLFTGKDLDGQTIGIAYIGSLCWAKKYAYSTIQSYGLLTATIFAHEIGHNLGATHDMSNIGTIMNTFINSGSPEFSAYSLGQINTFIERFGSCLTTESVTPSLDQASLTLTKVGKSVVISLVSQRGIGIDGQKIVYRVNGTVGSKTTSDLGVVKIRVRVKGKVTVKAKVAASPTLSVKKRFRF